MSFNLQSLQYSRLLLLMAAILFSVSCRRGAEKHTASGMRYIVYAEHEGPKARPGDVVTIEMVYKTDRDSVLFDSRSNGKPFRFMLQRPPFAGSYEEGLTCLAAGDSATFYISADSMVQKVFSKMAGGNYSRPGFLKNGSLLKFDIKMVQIQNELDAAGQQFHELDRLAAEEKTVIEKYVSDHHITVKPDSNGIYLVNNREGKGARVEKGKMVTVQYTEKFMNGDVFFSSRQAGRPYAFTAGRGEVIRGWEMAFLQLRQGDQATLIVPSAMAYGEEGVRNENNGSYRIPPNSPLVFDVEIMAVEDTGLR